MPEEQSEIEVIHWKSGKRGSHFWNIMMATTDLWVKYRFHFCYWVYFKHFNHLDVEANGANEEAYQNMIFEAI